MIDAGASFAYRQMKRKLAALNLQQAKIDYLILTHTHFDHTRNAAKIKSKYNCWIIISEKDRDFVKNGYTPIPGGTDRFTRLLSKNGEKIGKKWFGYQPFEGDIFVNDYFNLSDKGFDIQIIATPGHTEGSVSIIVDNEIAIAGDTMINIFKKTLLTPFADNPKEMVQSWKKLLDTSCRIFLPGHGKEISRDYLQKEYEKYKSIDF